MPQQQTLPVARLAVLALTLVLGLGRSQEPHRDALFRRSPLTNFICTGNLIFEEAVRSRRDCARLCMEDCTCVFFTYRELMSGIQDCRGHDHPSTYLGMTPSPGAEIYRLEKNKEDWHGKTCVSDSDCPVHLSVCFEGTCLCSPGNFYSNSSNTCVDTCKECARRPELVEYDRHAIWGYVATRIRPAERTLCLEAALNDTMSPAVTYDNAAKECNIHHVTAADVPAANWKTGLNAWDYFQKTCV